jgi:uncharacterized protein YutE (UPF0331/DUF86 family)
LILRAATVRQRLLKLRQIVRNLEEVRATPREEFIASYRHYWLAERGLQLAAETVFDTGSHLLAGRFNVYPEDYEDVIRLLAVHGVVSAHTRGRLTGLGGFRNVLVHQYLDIDEERVYAHLQEGLEDFSRFAAEIETFLAGLGEP